MSMSDGLRKTALDMAQEAMLTENAGMETAVPGSSLRNDAETGQSRSRAQKGTKNEEIGYQQKNRHNWRNSRVP